jgi:hypothetical protein
VRDLAGEHLDTSLGHSDQDAAALATVYELVSSRLFMIFFIYSHYFNTGSEEVPGIETV